MYYGNLSGGSSSGAIETDKTLKKPGVAADAEATGKALEEKLLEKAYPSLSMVLVAWTLFSMTRRYKNGKQLG